MQARVKVRALFIARTSSMLVCKTKTGAGSTEWRTHKPTLADCN